MKYFSLPADFRLKTIDEYVRLSTAYPGSKVLETYGQITVGTALESGRSLDQLPKTDLVMLKDYVEYSLSKGINFSYTINAPYMRNKEFTTEGIQEIYTLLAELKRVGVKSLTISMPSLMELILQSNFGFEVKVSTISQITNANKAMSFRRMGVGRIVADESINREFPTLQRIRNSYGDGVEVIANTVCLKDCVNRMFHYNQISGDSIKVSSEASVNYYSHRCMLKRCENLRNYLQLSWIRPEDLHYYTSIGVNYFKLQGRQYVLKGDPVRAVEHYFRESFDGNLMELLYMFTPYTSFNVYIDNKKLDGFVRTFYENPGFCKSDCSNCGYCESYAKKSMDYSKAQELSELAKKFFNDYDQFGHMIDSANRQWQEQEEKHEGKNFIEDDFEFDFNE